MTSPFLLANRPKTVDPNASPSTQASQANAPRVDPAAVDIRPKWQQVIEASQTTLDKESVDNSISPVAGSIPQSDYMNRFGPIKAIGDITAAGQISSSELQRQKAAQAAADALAKAQQDAVNNAYASSANTAIGGNGTTSYSGNVTYDGTDASLADMMRKAGFKDSEIGVGLGIIQAESSGNRMAVHPNTSGKYAGTVDQGLFQINTMHKGESWYPSDPFDPQQSINAAYALFSRAGRQWTDWTTYNQGLANAHSVPPTRLQVTATPSTNGGVFSTATGALRNQVVQASLQVLNIPYVWGGENMQRGVDCSGLVQQVYKQVLGRNLEHSASTQSRTAGTRVGSVNQLQPGDLIAFQWAGGYKGAGDVSHIAIYAGNGEIIEAAGGSHGDRRKLTNSSQDRGAIYIHVTFPGE